MKNLFIGLGVLAMIGATSCKKEYSCTCTNYDGVVTEYTVKSKEKNSSKDCHKAAGVTYLAGVQVDNIDGIVCVVK